MLCPDGTNGALINWCITTLRGCYTCEFTEQCEKFKIAYTANPRIIARIRAAKAHGADFLNKNWYDTEVHEGLTVRQLIELCDKTNGCGGCEAGLDGNITCRSYKWRYVLTPSEIKTAIKIPKEVFEENFLKKEVGKE